MKLTSTFDIAAPPSLVWDITTDVEHWNEWTPTITSIEWIEGDTIAVGNRARIKQPGQSAAIWTVEHVEPGREFRWSTKNMGARFVGTHVVEPGATGTRATLGIEASGIGAILMYPMLAIGLRGVLKKERAGLTALAEERARAAAPGD